MSIYIVGDPRHAHRHQLHKSFRWRLFHNQMPDAKSIVLVLDEKFVNGNAVAILRGFTGF